MLRRWLNHLESRRWSSSSASKLWRIASRHAKLNQTGRGRRKPFNQTEYRFFGGSFNASEKQGKVNPELPYYKR